MRVGLGFDYKCGGWGFGISHSLPLYYVLHLTLFSYIYLHIKPSNVNIILPIHTTKSLHSFNTNSTFLKFKSQNLHIQFLISLFFLTNTNFLYTENVLFVIYLADMLGHLKFLITTLYGFTILYVHMVSLINTSLKGFYDTDIHKFK